LTLIELKVLEKDEKKPNVVIRRRRSRNGRKVEGYIG
jgi:hypothetical protein